jgi:hypothetical protein
MRLTGTTATGVRLPIIGRGDDLARIVADCLIAAAEAENKPISESDVVGITEAVVAKAEGNFASVDDIGMDIRNKFGGGAIGVVYPIFSRNRFLNILKGIAAGAEKIFLLLNYPNDEVGNPLMDAEQYDRVSDTLAGRLVTGGEFRKITGAYSHPFTGVDYIDLYEGAADNIEVYVSSDPRDILKLTKRVLAADIHSRFITKRRLLAAGAETVYTLSDVLTENANGGGCNPVYGVLGSNLSTGDTLKLFPAKSGELVKNVQAILKARLGITPEVMVYGDGAFKDPAQGIWELADPVVSPGYSARLGGQPNEIKLKLIADDVFGGLTGETKREAVTNMIRNKTGGDYSAGTTPRKYADLLGSLCDLMSGSGDKGTPVVWIRGYFDNYASE